jgi:hypothetical protein
MATSQIAFDSSKKLLSMIGPNASGYTNAELDSLIGNMINYSTYDPSTGTLDEIINSGKLDIIQNQELKANISDWSGMLNDAKKDIEIANEHSFNVLVIYLNDKINLKNVPVPKRIREKTGLNITEPSLFPTNYEVFMRSNEFENLFDFHALNIIYLMSEYLNIKEYLELNLRLLEGEIQGS